ncbi:MAG: hypothetical protein ACFFD2_04110 [Promethearchaeota archaeon]
MKIGFAITAYDKFEEAKILFEIIRKEFKGDYQISFCSNHPNGKEFAEENNVNNYKQGRDIPYFGGDRHSPNKLKDKVSIILRSTDTVQNSCIAAMEMDVDYIIHMHSDAWVLNETKLIELIEKLKSMNKKLAVRGAGLEQYYKDSPFGHMDDHFFVFEKKYFLENNIFDFLPEEFWPHRFTIHGILFTNFLIKLGLKRIWYYRDTKDLLCFDGKKMNQRGVRPSSFDPYYKFLHLHRGSFPYDYGQKVQAMYLKEAGFQKSEFIKQFINRYFLPKDNLLNTLLEMEKKLNNKLKRYLFEDTAIQNREITFKQKLAQTTNFKRLLRNFIKKIRYKFNIQRFSTQKQDKIKNIDEFYRDIINISDFVEDTWTHSIYKDKKI